MAAIDLSKLAPPNAIEALSFEVLLGEWTKRMQSNVPDFTALLESDPAIKEMQVGAWREQLTRGRVNDGTKANMLAFATGTDLDHLGANYNVERLIVIAGDPSAIPPTEDQLEADGDFRRRIQLKWESISTAGARGSYEFHALSADGQVEDVHISSPNPSEIQVYVLSRDGAANDVLLSKVTQALNADKVRPLGDFVQVFTAMVKEVSLKAGLVVGSGPDPQLILNAAREAISNLVINDRPLGREIPISAIHAALHQAGVVKVNVESPNSDLKPEPHEAIRFIDIDLSLSNG